MKKLFTHKKLIHSVQDCWLEEVIPPSYFMLMIKIQRLVANFHHHKIEKISGRLNGLESIYNNHETLWLHKTKTKEISLKIT